MSKREKSLAHHRAVTFQTCKSANLALFPRNDEDGFRVRLGPLLAAREHCQGRETGAYGESLIGSAPVIPSSNPPKFSWGSFLAETQ